MLVRIGSNAFYDADVYRLVALERWSSNAGVLTRVTLFDRNGGGLLHIDSDWTGKEIAAGEGWTDGVANDGPEKPVDVDKDTEGVKTDLDIPAGVWGIASTPEEANKLLQAALDAWRENIFANKGRTR